MLETRLRPPSLREIPAGKALFAHGEGVEAHRHRQGQLIYASAGVLVITAAGGTWVAPTNRIAWTPPGIEHYHRAYGETEMRLLQVSGEVGDLLPPRPTVFAVTPLLREALLALTDDRQLPLARRARLRDVVVDELIDLAEQSLVCTLYLPEPTDDRLRAATDRLHADPAAPATLADLGRAVGASERTLSRLFHTELGMGFHQWRTLLRIQRALIHLTQGRPVTDIAIALGWANPTSFIEAFTAIVGQTPGRYQVEARRTRS
jgi:AraC-like DNA-binding protein